MNDTDKLLRALIDALGFDIKEDKTPVFATNELVHQPSIPIHVIVEYKLVKRKPKDEYENLWAEVQANNPKNQSELT